MFVFSGVVVVVAAVVVVVVVGLVEEHMVCFGQQHSKNKVVVVVVAVVKDSTIKGWDDSSTRDCTYCWRGHNCSGLPVCTGLLF